MSNSAQPESDDSIQSGRVWRGHFVCMALERGLENVGWQEFACVIVPEPGDVMELWSADGRLVMRTDEVVASLVRHGRLYVRTRSETYRILTAADAYRQDGTGEVAAVETDAG